jgi:hypothetical protein
MFPGEPSPSFDLLQITLAATLLHSIAEVKPQITPHRFLLPPCRK